MRDGVLGDAATPAHHLVDQRVVLEFRHLAGPGQDGERRLLGAEEEALELLVALASEPVSQRIATGWTTTSQSRSAFASAARSRLAFGELGGGEIVLGHPAPVR
ncbi:MAG: hypothetical protein R3D25_15235 [Geminicoccaceae bacterium]